MTNKKKKKPIIIKKSFLNLGAGRGVPLDINKVDEPFLVSVDRMYQLSYSLAEIENWHNEWDRNSHRDIENNVRTNEDIFSFLTKYSLKFDCICAYRFLEHIPFTQILEMIYMISCLLDKGGIVDVIVPNYATLAHRILQEDRLLKVDEDGDRINPAKFEQENIITTTEVVNVPSDPHASIWTPERSKYYFEYEKRFKVGDINERFNYDGRDIYLRFKATRI